MDDSAGHVEVCSASALGTTLYTRAQTPSLRRINTEREVYRVRPGKLVFILYETGFFYRSALSCTCLIPDTDMNPAVSPPPASRAAHNVRIGRGYRINYLISLL